MNEVNIDTECRYVTTNPCTYYEKKSVGSSNNFDSSWLQRNDRGNTYG